MTDARADGQQTAGAALAFAILDALVIEGALTRAKAQKILDTAAREIGVATNPYGHEAVEAITNRSRRLPADK